MMMSTVMMEEGYNHEEAVQQALHIAHKNRSLSTSPMKKERRSCLKGASRSSSTTRRNITWCPNGHRCQEFEMYDEEDIDVVWFTGEEYDEMKAAFEFTVFMMDAGCPEKMEDDEHTTRGLEKRCEEGQWKRYERKRDYYNMVLDEQERQWDEDEDDQEKISEIAVAITRESYLEAQDQGVMDEIAVYGHALRAACLSTSRRSVSESTANTSGSEHDEDDMCDVY